MTNYLTIHWLTQTLHKLGIGSKLTSADTTYCKTGVFVQHLHFCIRLQTNQY